MRTSYKENQPDQSATAQIQSKILAHNHNLLGNEAVENPYIKEGCYVTYGVIIQGWDVRIAIYFILSIFYASDG